MKVTITEHTVDSVQARIDELCSVSAADLRAMTRTARCMRAASLAELYEHRARLFEQTRDNGLAGAVSPGSLNTMAMALSRAAQADRDSSKFWWTQAGAR